MVNQIYARIRDNRTDNKLKYDFKKNINFREKQVMSALYSIHYAQGITDVYSEKVEEAELGEIKIYDKFHVKPDYFFHVNGETTTYEIKFSNTGNFHQDTIYIKCGAVITMIKNPNTYPNGTVLIATPTSYLELSVHDIANYPIRVAEEYSTPQYKKKVYHIPVSDVADLWEQWLVPLKNPTREELMEL